MQPPCLLRVLSASRPPRLLSSLRVSQIGRVDKMLKWEKCRIVKNALNCSSVLFHPGRFDFARVQVVVVYLLSVSEISWNLAWSGSSWWDGDRSDGSAKVLGLEEVLHLLLPHGAHCQSGGGTIRKRSPVYHTTSRRSPSHLVCPNLSGVISRRRSPRSRTPR